MFLVRLRCSTLDRCTVLNRLHPPPAFSQDSLPADAKSVFSGLISVAMIGSEPTDPRLAVRTEAP